MIRASLLKDVCEKLAEHSILSPEDFMLMEYKNKDGEPCLSIQYRYNTDLYYKFHIPTKKSGEYSQFLFNSTFAPGRESATETVSATERKGLLTEVGAWQGRLYEDILSAPIVRQFNAHSTAIEALRVRLDSVPDEPLSKEDVVIFQQELEKIKEELQAQFGKEAKDKEELKHKVDALARDITFLKQSLEAVSKRQWSEMFMVRLMKWKDKFNLKQLSSGTKVLQALLPDSMSDQLNTIAEAVEHLSDTVDPK